MKTPLCLLSGVLLTPLFLGPPTAQARQVTPTKGKKTQAPATNTARIVDVYGRSDKKPPGAGDYSPLSPSDVLPAQTMIRTGEESAVLLLLPGGYSLRLGEKTVVRWEDLGKGKKPSVKLLSGQVWAVARGGATPPEIRTPSAIARATSALFGVGYELESDQSLVSVGDGIANVSLASGGWSAPVKARQFVRYLRNPQPNIRLRSPEILTQDAAQKRMWQTIRAEGWTNRQVPGDTIAKLKRGQEKQLRQLTFSVSVDN